MLVLIAILLFIFWLWILPMPTMVQADVPLHVPTGARGRVARRRGAVAMVDLSRRRAWFADGDDDPDDDDDDPPAIDVSSFSAEAQAYIKRLQTQLTDTKNESIGRRKYIEKIEARLTSLEDTQIANAKAQGNYKELYEAELKKTSELQVKAERASEYEAQIRASNDSRIEKLPDIWKETVPDLPPDKLAKWLDAFMPRALTPKAPDIGAGTNPGSGQPAKLTPEERQIAERYGMTAEEYIKYRD